MIDVPAVISAKSLWVDSHWRYSYINTWLPNGEYIRI